MEDSAEPNQDPGFIMDPDEEGALDGLEMTETKAAAMAAPPAVASPTPATVKANEAHAEKVSEAVSRATTAKPKFREKPLHPVNDFTLMLFQDLTEEKRTELWMNAVFLWLSLQPRKKLQNLYGNATAKLMKAVVNWMVAERITMKAMEPVLADLERMMTDATEAQVEPDDSDEGNVE